MRAHFLRVTSIQAMRFPFPFNRQSKATPDFEDTHLDESPLHQEASDPDLPQLAMHLQSQKSLAQRIVEWRVPLIIFCGALGAVAVFTHLEASRDGDRNSSSLKTSATVLDPTSVAKEKPRAKTASAPVAPAPSASASYAEKVRSEATALISSSSQGSAQVTQVTPLGSDLAAVDYVAQGRPGVAWVDLRHKLVILGTILDAQGRNLESGPLALSAATRAVASASSPVQAASGPVSGQGPQDMQGSAASVLQAMREAVGIKAGPPTGVPLWVFVDPDGSRSARFFNAQMPHGTSGALVTWVPVAYEDQQSAGRVAYMLTQLDPMRALITNFRNFNFSQSKGGIESVAPSVDMADVAIKNTRLLSRVGALETPTVLFCGKDGAPHVMAAPADLSSVVQIAGSCNLPAQ